MDLGLTRDCCHEKRKQIDPHGEAGLIEHLFLGEFGVGGKVGGDSKLSSPKLRSTEMGLCTAIHIVMCRTVVGRWLAGAEIF